MSEVETLRHALMDARARIRQLERDVKELRDNLRVEVNFHVKAALKKLLPPEPPKPRAAVQDYTKGQEVLL